MRLLQLREKDLNLRLLGYEPSELTTAPSRDMIDFSTYYIADAVTTAFYET